MCPSLTTPHSPAPTRRSVPFESQLGIYVHIPYCIAKCPYCDFASVASSSWPEREYVAALKREVETYAATEFFGSAVVSTVYFGGGTPSLFSPWSFEQVLSTIAKHWRMGFAPEITMEANPGTVDVHRLKALRAAGINRLSLGVQSFDDEHLKLLGRIHGAKEAEAAVVAAFASGFENVNIDLIYALPGQTLQAWERDLLHACTLKPTHISAYNLTYEEGTPFFSWRKQGRLNPVDEETEVAMFTLAESMLSAHGYARYEISNYAKPSYACRHNLAYWRCQPFVGIGAGAHGYCCSGGEYGWGFRWANHRSPSRYLKHVGQHGHARLATEHLRYAQAAGEFVFLALRCVDGLDAFAFTERFGQCADQVFPVIRTLAANGLLEPTECGWRLSPRGTLVADSVFAEFL